MLWIVDLCATARIQWVEISVDWIYAVLCIILNVFLLNVTDYCCNRNLLLTFMKSSIAPRTERSACHRGSKATFAKASHRMSDQYLLTQAPPYFGRHVKPLVLAAFAVVCTHSSFNKNWRQAGSGKNICWIFITTWWTHVVPNVKMSKKSSTLWTPTIHTTISASYLCVRCGIMANYLPCDFIYDFQP
jgi:hypothetical protein